MSYSPGREKETIFFAAWSSTNQNLPSRTSGSGLDWDSTYDITLELDSTLNDLVSIENNSIKNSEGLKAYYLGDARSTTSDTSGELNYYNIEFKDTDMSDQNYVIQDQRVPQSDDTCCSVYTSAELKIKKVYRIGGNTISPYVRVIGFIKE